MNTSNSILISNMCQGETMCFNVFNTNKRFLKVLKSIFFYLINILQGIAMLIKVIKSV
jgi:hypothetical protein